MLRFVVVLFVIALVVYLTTRAVERRLSGPQAPPRTPGRHPSQGPARPVAPDDDPEFLRNLDWEERKRRHKARGDEPNPGSTEGSTDSGDPAPES